MSNPTERERVGKLAALKAEIAERLARYSRPEPEIGEVFAELTRRGIPFGIATSSPRAFCREIVPILSQVHKRWGEPK